MNNDFISREAMLKEVRENKELFESERVYLEGLLLNAPTVEPTENSAIQYSLGYQDGFIEGEKLKERPQGEWNEIQAGMLICPFCGARPHKDFKNFCANCGADMRGEKE